MIPVRFEVLVNDRLLCLAGMDCDGVLMVTVEAENMPRGEGGSSLRGSPGGKVQTVSVCGFTAEDVALRWPEARISAGDEIRIRVLPSGRFDPPTVEVPELEG